ncbi:MAG: MCE family protein [Myxococcales bacterium]|nr:MAG: MCE family protein [Myxococcales bacterium]
MTRGIKIRLLLFVILSAVGIVYVAGTYLGLVDKALGRGLTIHATLPTSGGLFEGSEVTYRGVKVGRITRMEVTDAGLRVTMGLKEGTRIPKDSPFFVHNLSAVGEQYLDFEPKSTEGPFAEEGDTIAGSAASLPVAEERLLTELDGLVGSVDNQKLATTVRELGAMFRGTALPMRRIVDSGSQFVADARAHEKATVDLFRSGQTVLSTQKEHSADIRGFASDLAALTQTLKASDPQLRTLLQGGSAAVREVNSLLTGLEPTLPVFIGNLVTVNQVLTARLPAVEQLLVTFPRVIQSGFTGTPGDGFGYINLQLSTAAPACTKGYLPRSQWREGTDLSDKKFYPAKCLDRTINKRGSNFAPPVGESQASNYRVSPYDARTGTFDAGNGRQVQHGTQGGLKSVFGDNAWQWMLIGPVDGLEKTRR